MDYSSNGRQLRQYLLKRWASLKSERSNWEDLWKEICLFVSPYSSNLDGIREKDRSYNYILDNVAEHDLQILVSGFASSTTSPIRPWFRLTAPNPKLENNQTIREYLDNLQKILLKTFQLSDTYANLHVFYQELCLFGIAVDLIYDDEENIIQHHILTVGDYCVATNHKNEVDTLYREFELTVKQACELFDFDKLSRRIQQDFNQKRYDVKYKFLHAIEPRLKRDFRSDDNKNMPYASYYVELSTDNDKPILKESGFSVKPFICARWNVIANSVYGTSPSIQALPDIKQLQQETLRKSQIIDKIANPPMEVPNNSRQSPIDLSSGGINFVNSVSGQQSIRPIYSPTNELSAIQQSIADIKQAISDKYFIQLFMPVTNNQSDRKTATEVNALQQEQRLVLGSVVERLNNELGGALIKITLSRLWDLGIIEPPPQELGSYEIEFQSVLAQAQRAVDLNATDRLIATVQSISASDPSILDRLNADGVFDVYADRLAVDSALIRSQEDADKIREQRAQAQQQAMQLQQAQQGASAIRDLSQAQKLGSDASLATQELEPIGVY